MKCLPPDISQGAVLRGNEYGWSVSSFPSALASAQGHGYACLGGQFQFRLDDDSTCEMYWLGADSKERAEGESWVDYCHRSCSEVLNRFQHLVSATDFKKEASSWPSVQINPTMNLVFVAYFVSEGELAELTKNVAR
jgi:predicted ATPase